MEGARGPEESGKQSEGWASKYQCGRKTPLRADSSLSPPPLLHLGTSKRLPGTRLQPSERGGWSQVHWEFLTMQRNGSLKSKQVIFLYINVWTTKGTHCLQLIFQDGISHREAGLSWPLKCFPNWFWGSRIQMVRCYPTYALSAEPVTGGKVLSWWDHVHIPWAQNEVTWWQVWTLRLDIKKKFFFSMILAVLLLSAD